MDDERFRFVWRVLVATMAAGIGGDPGEAVTTVWRPGLGQPIPTRDEIREVLTMTFGEVRNRLIPDTDA